MENAYKNFIELFNTQFEKTKNKDFNFSAYIVLIRLLDKILELGQKLNTDTKIYAQKKEELLEVCKKHGYTFKD